MSDTSSDDDDFANFGSVGAKRYPVHDCCEFEDAESLRSLIFVRQDDSDDEDNGSMEEEGGDSDSDSSSDDSNDSHAAAHAAAIGHSPHPLGTPTAGSRPMKQLDVTALAEAVAANAEKIPHIPMMNITTAGASGESSPEKVDASSTTTATTRPNDDASAKEKTTEQEKEPTTNGNKETKGETKSGENLSTTSKVSPSSTEGEAEQSTPNQQTKSLEQLQADSATTAVVVGTPKEDRQEQHESSSRTVTSDTMDISPEAKAPEEGSSVVSKDGTTTKEEEAADRPKNDAARGDDAAAPSNKKIAHKKNKKKKVPKPPKEPTYYCPYDLNERDEDENTPLHVAIHARKLEHVKLLIEAGSSVHKKCDGSAPIHTCISMGSVRMHAEFAYECTVILAENGADLTVRDDCQHSPLYLACMVNLPSVVSYILTRDSDVHMLNARADRMGGRALHAAAKYDFPTGPGIRRSAGGGDHNARGHHHHHPDGTINHSGHHPGGVFRVPSQSVSNTSRPDADGGNSGRKETAMVTQVLLETPGIEVDAKNSYGQTPLHVACGRGNWPVVRLLLRWGSNPHVTDRRGFSPGQVAQKRGMAIPQDLLPVLGDALTPTRDLIVDPNGTTLICCHELCSLHRSCPPIRRDTSSDPPPENVRRLHVLINEQVGILRSGEFTKCSWEGEARRAAMADVLKVHEYNYIEKISQLISAIPDHPSAIAHLDADTAVSRWSFEAAMRAAGGVCEAVDKVVSGDFRNAFCAVRPPGHHAGPRGIVRCANDPDGGSHGFCLLNNVAIGAAYARSMYRNDGIRKIAIVDFDVHHGNGTEEIIRQLIPTQEKAVVRTPFAVGELASTNYRPWLDESDINDVFFASTHGYGPRSLEFSDHPAQGGWFYPASGKTHTADAILNPSVVESPNVSDFLLSQTWARMGEESRMNCCKIINCGLSLPQPDAIPGMQRVELRDTYRTKVFPHLREFDPDIIFISAGFDAHKRDSMNFGYVGMVEDDYEWVTEQLVKIANTCCNGRIVSVLEGGYKIHGGIVSPFARSVASHVRALVDGGNSRELYDPADGEWDSQFERHMVEERERRRQQKLERLNRAAEESRRELYESVAATAAHASRASATSGETTAPGGGHPDAVDALMTEPLKDHHPPTGNNHDMPSNGSGSEQPARKRRRGQVDYKALYEQMKREEVSAE